MESLLNTRCVVHEFSRVCTRAIGNLAPKRIWVHFIEAKAVYLGSEREKEAVLLEEMHGNQELMDFYDLVNSPVQSSSKEYNAVVQASATVATSTTRGGKTRKLT